MAEISRMCVNASTGRETLSDERGLAGQSGGGPEYAGSQAGTGSEVHAVHHKRAAAAGAQLGAGGVGQAGTLQAIEDAAGGARLDAEVARDGPRGHPVLARGMHQFLESLERRLRQSCALGEQLQL